MAFLWAVLDVVVFAVKFAFYLIVLLILFFILTILLIWVFSTIKRFLRRGENRERGEFFKWYGGDEFNGFEFKFRKRGRGEKKEGDSKKNKKKNEEIEIDPN